YVDANIPQKRSAWNLSYFQRQSHASSDTSSFFLLQSGF
ncbi:unnamed protein product, partial [Acanthoscelides obtectus]